jgi:imidazolonepropionase-like amidohydrolase
MPLYLPPKPTSKKEERTMTRKHNRNESARSRGISRREFIKLAAAGLLAGCRSARQPDAAPTSAATLVLVNGTLIDGAGAGPITDAALMIQETRIVAVGPRTDAAIPSDAQIVDVQGATILPGFINAHVHGAYDEETLKAWAREGVTTVRDLANGGDRDSLFAFRDEALTHPEYARLVAAGPMVTVPNGYPIAPWNVDSLTVASPKDAREKVVQLLDNGADVIKIPLESGVIFGQDLPMLSPEEAAAIVQVAHERGAMVSAHVSVSRDLELALDAGVDDIAHMVTDELPDELIQRIIAADVYWVPTLELWKGVGHGLGDLVVDNLRRFVNAGGKVALGTDYAGAPNVNFDLGMPIHEIEWMQEAGMTPMQIIVAGTRNGAHVCGLEYELGTLEVGKIADVLVVDGDPLEDIHVLTNVRTVIRNGVVIWK